MSNPPPPICALTFTTPTVTPLQLAQVQLDLEFLMARQEPKVSLPVEVDNGIHQNKVMPIDGLTLEQQRERARQLWGGDGRENCRPSQTCSLAAAREELELAARGNSPSELLRCAAAFARAAEAGK